MRVFKFSLLLVTATAVLFQIACSGGGGRRFDRSGYCEAEKKYVPLDLETARVAFEKADQKDGQGFLAPGTYSYGSSMYYVKEDRTNLNNQTHNKLRDLLAVSVVHNANKKGEYNFSNTCFRGKPGDELFIEEIYIASKFTVDEAGKTQIEELQEITITLETGKALHSEIHTVESSEFDSLKKLYVLNNDESRLYKYSKLDANGSQYDARTYRKEGNVEYFVSVAYKYEAPKKTETETKTNEATTND